MEDISSPPAAYTWRYVFGVAREHRRELILANVLAVMAALLAVPVPLLMPLMVDEVLLGHPATWVGLMNRLFPVAWQGAIGYIAGMLALTVGCRLSSTLFGVWQTRKFTIVAKDVTYRIRRDLLARMGGISMAEYESMRSGAVASRLVTDIETIDAFTGVTIAKFLVAIVQSALAALGYQPGPVDGLFGARTRTAIEKFERERGLRVTGQVSSDLLAQLNAKLASSEPNRPPSMDLSPQRTSRLVPTNEERSIAGSACAGKKALYGPAAYDSCVAEKLAELQNLGRRPNLGGISSSERSAITNACAGKKALYGPASYYTCVEEKLAELASVGTAPSFSGVSASERSAIENACAGKKALYGPASYYECVREKISELTRSAGAPDFAGVSRSERDAIENACAGKKALYGPAAFYACARDMVQELRQLSTRPDLSRVSYADRSAIENACAGKKAMYGPAAFYRCVEQQIAALR